MVIFSVTVHLASSATAATTPWACTIGRREAGLRLLRRWVTALLILLRRHLILSNERNIFLYLAFNKNRSGGGHIYISLFPELLKRGVNQSCDCATFC